MNGPDDGKRLPRGPVRFADLEHAIEEADKAFDSGVARKRAAKLVAARTLARHYIRTVQGPVREKIPTALLTELEVEGEVSVDERLMQLVTA